MTNEDEGAPGTRPAVPRPGASESTSPEAEADTADGDRHAQTAPELPVLPYWVYPDYGPDFDDVDLP